LDSEREHVVVDFLQAYLITQGAKNGLPIAQELEFPIVLSLQEGWKEMFDLLCHMSC
jgi:hypothetical protein